jgi:Ribosomal S17.
MGRVVSKQIKRIGYLLFEKRKDLFKNKFEDIKESLRKLYGNKLTKKERNVLAGYIARLVRYEIKKTSPKGEEVS